MMLGSLKTILSCSFLLVCLEQLCNGFTSLDIVPGAGELREPTRLNLSAIDTLYLYVVGRPLTIGTGDGLWAINITTRMYCYSIDEYTDTFNDSNCGIPGPTLIMQPGTTVTIRLYNQLTGIGHLNTHMKNDTCHFLDKATNWFYYNNPDVTNLHVHGLHVSPYVDDVVDDFVNPICPEYFTADEVQDYGFRCINGTQTGGVGEYSEYVFEIPSNHYPGSHWYHAHVHGSVTLQVGGGLFGMINMDPRSDLESWAPQILPENDHNLMVAWSWLHDNSVCEEKITKSYTATNNFRADGFCHNPVTRNGTDYYFIYQRGYTPFNFPIQSLCFINCNMEAEYSGPNKYLESILNLTNVTYDININEDVFGKLEFRGWTVNGMFQPRLKMNTNEWHRLRIVTANMNYLLWTTYSNYDENSNSGTFVSGDNLQVWLVANDGVYFEDGPRQGWLPPYDSTIVVPPGARADLIIRGLSPGNYTVVASNDTRVDVYPAFNEAPVPLRNQVIMYIEVTGPESNLTDTYNTECKDWNDTALPCEPQPYKYSRYLDNTLIANEANQINSKCVSPYSSDLMDQCNLVLEKEGIAKYQFWRTHPSPSPTACQTAINGIKYAHGTPLMTVPTNVTREWTVTSNFHPFHHHTWPFQLQRDVTDGWIARKGDWRDTVGAAGSFTVRSNYYDFLTGKLVVHCHFVPHEDHGMMAWINMTDIESYEAEFPDPIEPITQSSGNYSDDTTGIKACEDGIQRVSLALIDSIDVETLMSYFMIVFGLEGECYLGTLGVTTFRPGFVDNAWIAMGLGGTYADDASSSSMTGTGIVWSLQAQDGIALSKLNVKEVTLYNDATWTENNYTYTKCNNETSLFTFDNGNSTNQVAYFYCIRPITDTFSFIDEQTESTNFIWAYGEGRFQQQRMHSARGLCDFEFFDYNASETGLNEFIAGESDVFSYSYCLHKQNTINYDTSNDENVVSERLGADFDISLSIFTSLISTDGDVGASGDSNDSDDSDTDAAYARYPVSLVSPVSAVVFVLVTLWSMQ